jgi:hypothetical protein
MTETGSATLAVTAAALAGVVLWRLRTDLREARVDLDGPARLGFAPCEPRPLVGEKIGALYAAPDSAPGTRDTVSRALRNVAVRRLIGCDLLLFDLIETVPTATRVVERQGLAVLSEDLRLPRFSVLPDVQDDGNASSFTDCGALVGLAAAPDFTRRHKVLSPDPDGTRRFLDGPRLRQLATLRLPIVRAGGRVFTMSGGDPTGARVTADALEERIELALLVYANFCNGR